MGVTHSSLFVDFIQWVLKQMEGNLSVKSSNQNRNPEARAPIMIFMAIVLLSWGILGMVIHTSFNLIQYQVRIHRSNGSHVQSEMHSVCSILSRNLKLVGEKNGGEECQGPYFTLFSFSKLNWLHGLWSIHLSKAQCYDEMNEWVSDVMLNLILI